MGSHNAGFNIVIITEGIINITRNLSSNLSDGADLKEIVQYFVKRKDYENLVALTLQLGNNIVLVLY